MIYVTYCIGFINVFPGLYFLGVEWVEPGIAWRNFRLLIGILLLFAAGIMHFLKKNKQYIICLFMFLIFTVYWAWYYVSVQFLEKQVDLLVEGPEFYGPHFGVLSNAGLWDWIVLTYCILMFSVSGARIIAELTKRLLQRMKERRMGQTGNTIP
jgi:hypothetical protein